MMKIHSALIVDDSESDQMLAQIAIEEFDSSINILQAYDGEEALEILNSSDEQPDVIFLDINMPGMDGHEFLKTYNEKDDHSPIVVMLTSSNNKRDKDQCMAFPFVKKYIIKPLILTMLKEIENSF
jgi:CheY-like chemotaxis protein